MRRRAGGGRRCAPPLVPFFLACALAASSLPVCRALRHPTRNALLGAPRTAPTTIASRGRGARASAAGDYDPASEARIQFVVGTDEPVVPTISMTRSATTIAMTRSATTATARETEFFTGTATFWFKKARALYGEFGRDDELITGMTLLDVEGSLVTEDVPTLRPSLLLFCTGKRAPLRAGPGQV